MNRGSLFFDVHIPAQRAKLLLVQGDSGQRLNLKGLVHLLIRDPICILSYGRARVARLNWATITPFEDCLILLFVPRGGFDEYAQNHAEHMIAEYPFPSNGSRYALARECIRVISSAWLQLYILVKFNNILGRSLDFCMGSRVFTASPYAPCCLHFKNFSMILRSGIPESWRRSIRVCFGPGTSLRETESGSLTTPAVSFY